MIILDTNILSELMKSAPEPKVESWLEQQLVTQLFITTISIAEILYGIGILPNDKRRDALENGFQHAINNAFKHRVLSFDEAAANAYGVLMSKRKKMGKPLGILDGKIAAIALINSAILATRNIRDFTNCNLELVDPFFS
ncbi:MAG: type II toxin-antitoxin system VapC family toxin [Gammaproteobacteria bacterium]|nr:type II toxin-antitoxin system VapC family toxin [Gammaproteobacteria bacterium]